MVMKVRNGFVSNSSSSSFIITFDEDVIVQEVDLDQDEYYVVGKYMTEGYDYFKIENKEMLKVVKDISEYNDILILKNPKKISQGDWSDYYNDVTITQDMVGKRIIFIEKDYHCTTDIDSLMVNYGLKWGKYKK